MKKRGENLEKEKKKTRAKEIKIERNRGNLEQVV